MGSLGGVTRLRLLLAAGLCAAAAAAIWALAFGVPAVQSADVDLLSRFLHRGGPRATEQAWNLAALLDPVPGALLAAALVARAALAGRRRQAVVAAVAIGGAAVTAQLLKAGLAAQRDYPPGHYMPPESWPSGHTAGVVSLALALVIVSPPALRWLAALAGAALSGAMMLAILVLGTHYPSDVAGGALVALGWTCLAAAALPSAVAARLPQRLAPAGGDVDAA
jgi:membrane-associated phospholipid phosphatase